MPRHLAIGDIHGCYQSFKSLLEFINLREDDVLITLGDYCDRGPNTYAVIDYLIHLHASGNLRPLRGNHEIMTLHSRDNREEFEKWINVGGDATLLSYAPFEGDCGRLTDVPDSHWRFLQSSLLPYYETDSHYFVHGNAYQDVPLADQHNYKFYWEQFGDPSKLKSGKTMVCAHPSQKSGLPATSGNVIYIDTWVCRSGWLTCLDVDSGKIWQANERGETRELWLDEL
ncbi:metallophosphoesterase [Mariniblastus sp.]|nr:metallophosphoesterase [Mariniblastus sp.]